LPRSYMRRDRQRKWQNQILYQARTATKYQSLRRGSERTTERRSRNACRAPSWLNIYRVDSTLRHPPGFRAGQNYSLVRDYTPMAHAPPIAPASPGSRRSPRRSGYPGTATLAALLTPERQVVEVGFRDARRLGPLDRNPACDNFDHHLASLF
jgi:hypothetical protein